MYILSADFLIIEKILKYIKKISCFNRLLNI